MFHKHLSFYRRGAGGVMRSVSVWLSGPMFFPRVLCPERGSLSRGGFSVWGEVLCLEGDLCLEGQSPSRRGGLCPEEGLCRETPPGIRKEGGTHPTGTLSCFSSDYYVVIVLQVSSKRYVNLTHTLHIEKLQDRNFLQIQNINSCRDIKITKETMKQS